MRKTDYGIRYEKKSDNCDSQLSDFAIFNIFFFRLQNKRLCFTLTNVRKNERKLDFIQRFMHINQYFAFCFV